MDLSWKSIPGFRTLLQAVPFLGYSGYVKILMVSMSYPDFAGSYRGIFIQKLCRELIRQGHHVLVVTPRIFRRSLACENDGGIRVYRFRFPSGDRPLGQTSGIPVTTMVWFMMSGLMKTFSVIMKERPDIIHGNWIVPTGLIAALCGFITRIPVINTARGMDVRISDSGFIRLLFNLAVRLSRRIVVVSSAMKTRRGLEHAEVISSGVDDVFFTITPDRGSATIISTRSLEPVYDIETLLKSLPEVRAQYPSVRCILAGTGSQEIHLKTLARQLGIEDAVMFTGVVPQEEIIRLMQQSHVFVSTCADDGTSVALLEAVAAGLVPVVADIPTNRAWVVHAYDGYLFSPGNAHSLALSLTEALGGKIDGNLLRMKRANLAERIAWPAIAGHYVSIYRYVVSLRGRRPCSA